MLANILDDEDDAFVFFYEDNDTDAHTILEELEQIDEKLDKQDLTLVKIRASLGHPLCNGIFQVKVRSTWSWSLLFLGTQMYPELSLRELSSIL